METIGDLYIDSPHGGLGHPRHLHSTLTMISERAQRELRALVVLICVAVVILTGVLLIW
jgi:hypothetical protein